MCDGTLKQGTTTDRAAIQPAIKILLTEIHSKLNEAARIAKAAEACAEAGSIRQPSRSVTNAADDRMNSKFSVRQRSPVEPAR